MYASPTAVAPYLVRLLEELGYPTRLRNLSGNPNGYAQVADSRAKAQAFLFLDYAPYPSASQLIDIYFGCQILRSKLTTKWQHRSVLRSTPGRGDPQRARR
jgi:hypothetical protein